MMRQENCAAAASPRNFGKKRVTSFARCGFDRHPLFLCECANVCRTDLKIDTVFRGEVFYKARIGSAIGDSNGKRSVSYSQYSSASVAAQRNRVRRKHR